MIPGAGQDRKIKATRDSTTAINKIVNSMLA
jgi:hypothetical protein